MEAKRRNRWFGPTVPCTALGVAVGMSLPLSYGSIAPIAGAVIGFIFGLLWDSTVR